MRTYKNVIPIVIIILWFWKEARYLFTPTLIIIKPAHQLFFSFALTSRLDLDCGLCSGKKIPYAAQVSNGILKIMGRDILY